MGLVDYDSDGSGSSDGEAPVTAPIAKPTTTATGGKKPFQKLVDRANPGKILVSLPSATTTGEKEGGDDDDDGRPAKRAKVGAGGGRFSGFGSFLPPPKKSGAAAATAATTISKPESSSSLSSFSSTSRSGVNLKTSSEAAFSRRDNNDGDGTTSSANTQGSGSNDTPSRTTSSSFSKIALPPPKAPSIPQDQKAAEDVKLVGNPLMFMPLSVSRKPGGKKKTGAGKTAGVAGQKRAPTGEAATQPSESTPQYKKKVSLFSLDADDQAEAERASAAERSAEDAAAERTAAETAEDYQSIDYSSTYQETKGYGYEGQQYYAEATSSTGGASSADTSSLNTIANDLHLSAKERRELFGRTGSAAASAQIAATFNMDQEYRHNEALRHADDQDPQSTGQQQSHNPVRTLMPGRHSLRQLVNQVHTQQDALEETFAKNRQSQREAGGKYGWR